jgi:hypothetical protein
MVIGEKDRATYLFPEVQGLRIYWHIGNSKKASATVAMTAKKYLKNNKTER